MLWDAILLNYTQLSDFIRSGCRIRSNSTRDPDVVPTSRPMNSIELQRNPIGANIGSDRVQYRIG